MSFVKLDCGILDSTLWADRDAKDIFITALLMAVPHELTEPTPQLNVSALAATDWTIPPGWYGLIAAASVGIVRRAGLPLADGLAALERLGAPEIESRSTDFDGRRLVRIDGGFLALNFQKYRDRDYSAAERSRRYRQKRTADDPEPDTVTRSVTVVTRDGRDVTRDITQAEAEAEAETDTQKQTGSVWDFEGFRKTFPPGTYPDSAWPAALALGQTLIAKGEATGPLLNEQAGKYYNQQRGEGRLGTRYVRNPASFLSDGFFRGPFPVSVDAHTARANAKKAELAAAEDRAWDRVKARARASGCPLKPYPVDTASSFETRVSNWEMHERPRPKQRTGADAPQH